jgi:hypothetical protein
MNANEYKTKCQQPHVLRRPTLEATARIVAQANTDLAVRLHGIVAGQPIPKPASHTGNAETDFFEVDLSREEAHAVLSILLSAEADAVSPHGETTPQASSLADIVDLWGRYYKGTGKPW